MEQKIVFAQNTSIELDMGMSQSAFSKARITERLSESGLLAEKRGGSWYFLNWNFTGSLLSDTKEGGTPTVRLTGSGFEGFTLSELFASSEKAKAACAAALVCAALEESIRQEKSFALVGGGGIIVSHDFSKVLFLPADLFLTAVKCRGDNFFSEQSGFYLYEVLKGTAAIHFLQSVIAYRALTGVFPFTEPSSQKRSEDFLDHNYIPLKNKIWALDEKLSFFVDSSLQNSQAKTHRASKGIKDESVSFKVEIIFPLQTFYRELGLTENGEIPIGATLQNVIRKSSESPEEFESKSKKEQKKFENSLKLKRTLRHHRVFFTGLAVAALIVVFVSLTIVQSRGEKPTTKGLYSWEVAEVFYSAYNTLDVSAAENYVTGKKLNKIIDIMSNIYVSGKARAVYEVKEETVSPAEWLVFNYDGNYNIFGLTQFSLDSEKAELFSAGPVRSSKPKAVTEEGGISVKDGNEKLYTATYIQVFSESEETLSLIYRTDLVHLLYKKNQWLVSEIEQKDTYSTEVSFKDFIADWKECASDADENILSVANRLREKHPWIPTNSEILAAEAHLKATSLFSN